MENCHAIDIDVGDIYALEMYAMRSHSSFVECILYIISNLWHLSLPLRVPLPFDVKQFQIKNRLNFVFICFAWIRFDNLKVVVVVAQLTPIEPTNKEWINCNSKLSHILCFIYRVYTLRNRRRRSNEHTNEIAISVGSMTTKEQHVLLAQNTISIHVILFDAFECEFWRVAARRTQKAKKKLWANDKQNSCRRCQRTTGFRSCRLF